jgi:NTP pyrophosphatase (non-canonical NTP hydrolase)
MTLDISTAVHASHKVNQPRDVFQVMAYLASETGECADWLVNPDRQKEDLLGECADVIICALDLALLHKKSTSGLDGQELADEVVGHLNDLLKVKAEKWLDKHAAD